MIGEPSIEDHPDDGAGRKAPVLVWRFGGEPVRAASSSVLGGGLGIRAWITNATVTFGYAVPDPPGHAGRIADACGLEPSTGCGLLTGVDVRGFVATTDGGAEIVATVGLGAVTLAAAPDGQYEVWSPGTVNVVAWVPAPLDDGALVNLVATIAEAKAQALADCGVLATGTPTDATVACCPAAEPPDDDDHRYGGPRSRWGAPMARAAYAAIVEGVRRDGTGWSP